MDVLSGVRLVLLVHKPIQTMTKAHTEHNSANYNNQTTIRLKCQNHRKRGVADSQSATKPFKWYKALHRILNNI